MALEITDSNFQEILAEACCGGFLGSLVWPL